MGYYQTLDARIRPISMGNKIAGRAYTIGPVVRDVVPREQENPVTKFESISRDKERFLGDIQPGDIVVMKGGGGESIDMGENTACAIKTRGGVGIIVDGSCRDIQGIRDELKIPCYCKIIRPGGNVIQRKELKTIVSTECNIPIDCGGVRVYPGDIVLGDDSGVVFIPKEIFEETLEFMEAYAELDNSVTKRLLQGLSVGEAYRTKVNWAAKIGLTEYLEKKRRG